MTDAQLNVIDELERQHDADAAAAATREWIGDHVYQRRTGVSAIVAFDSLADRDAFLVAAGIDDGRVKHMLHGPPASPTPGQWVDLPYFNEPGGIPKIEVAFATRDERAAMFDKMGITNIRRGGNLETAGVRWPERDRVDQTSVKFAASPSSPLPRFPVYIPSRGRYERPLTIRFFEADGVPHRVVVRSDEADAYRRVIGEHGEFVVLPATVSNLVETRNWIRDHAERGGHEAHWQFDDNIYGCRRLYRGARLPCASGPALAAVEDFALRYDNVGIAGMAYYCFTLPGRCNAYTVNAHIYSATLVCHRMPCRWDLVYNDDTDLCLEALSAGWATLLSNALSVSKVHTMTMRGGNTDVLYQGDGRMHMARALERKWPGLVRVHHKWGRPTHYVDWSRFRSTPTLAPNVDVASLPPYNEYGLELRSVKDVRHPRLRELIRDHARLRGVKSNPFASVLSPKEDSWTT